MYALSRPSRQVGCCSGVGLVGFGAEQVAPKQYFDFTEKQMGGKTLRVIDDPSQKSWFKVTFVGWEITEPPSGALIPGTLTRVHQPPTANQVKSIPFIQSAPQEVGNLFRWVEGKLAEGQGIVVVPPATWVNGDDLLRWEIGHPPAPTTPKPGNVVAMATTVAAEAAQLASPGMHGFVLYEPKAGWMEGTWASPPIPGPGPPAAPPGTSTGSKTALYVGLGISAVVVGGLLLKAFK